MPDHRYTMDLFRAYVGQQLDDAIQTVSYDKLVMQPALAEGPAPAFIFTDLDRTSFPSVIAAAWNRYRAANPRAVCINHPTRTHIRFELLKALHQAGINRFNVHSLMDRDRMMRFPVFLRLRGEHKNPVTGLLKDRAALDDAIERLLDHYARQELMIVEFQDTVDAQGIYRKYSAFLIGNVLIPHHIQFSREWLLKRSILDDERFLDEELAYVQTPEPREAQLRAIFAQAGIGYGRIDFAVDAAGLQVWEINTNPMIVGREAPTGRRKQVRDHVVGRIVDAFRRLACDPAAVLQR